MVGQGVVNTAVAANLPWAMRPWRPLAQIPYYGLHRAAAPSVWSADQEPDTVAAPWSGR